ncbi:MAG: hypothetical protein RL674_1526 [Pseudomonadota bacterium]|jgi:uncharacterized protein (DUF4415 family)|nr:BrnA antitoxin family protein [Methylococcales bacterium]
MRDEYDFKHAKRAYEVPHLAKLQAENNKTRITICLDNDILANFKERAAQGGKGYQTLINETLRANLKEETPLTAETLRKILHEELANVKNSNERYI